MDWGILGAAALVYFAAEPIGRVATRIGRLGPLADGESKYYSAYCASRGGALIGLGCGIYEIASLHASILEWTLFAPVILGLYALMGFFAPALIDSVLWLYRLLIDFWLLFYRWQIGMHIPTSDSRPDPLDSVVHDAAAAGEHSSPDVSNGLRSGPDL